ncbi:MAG: SMI1/KNR4 family protein [Solirubrobacteraceae bacterium]
MTDRWRHLAKRKGFALSPPPPSGSIAEAEERLGHPLSEALRSLYEQTDGFVDEWGCSCVMRLADLVAENEQMRGGEDYRALYMPFDSILFFGQMGNGDLLFQPVLAGGVREDVFLWNHEDDSRAWYARDVPKALKRACLDEGD